MPGSATRGRGNRVTTSQSESTAKLEVEQKLEDNAIVGQTSTGKPLRRGYIEDFISGEPVQAGPEEIKATQVITRRLVQEYGWPKEYIQTRPQFRVKTHPSDESMYPVDAVAFTVPHVQAAYGDIYAIVECKSPDKKTGEHQLKIYLQNAPSAKIGIWYNGKDQPVVVWKRIEPNGTMTFPNLFAIPRWSQDPATLTRPKRGDLVPPVDLAKKFSEIRNYLAGMATGISRDEALARNIEILGLLKIHDELHTPKNEHVTVGVSVDESPTGLKKRLVAYLGEVRKDYDVLFDEGDAITLDAQSLAYVVGQLNQIALTEAPRDALVQAFEVFIGPATRGTEGQFHTPANAAEAIIAILDPKPQERFLDDACGGGTFLVAALKHVWQRLEEKAKCEEWSGERLGAEKTKYITRYLRGIDKDSFLARTAAAWITMYASTMSTETTGVVYVANSLLPPNDWMPKMQDDLPMERQHVMGVNPPYGSKIRVAGENILKQFDLAHRFSKDDDAEGLTFEKGVLLPEQAPQILFLDRNLQFLDEGGRMGIVLLESIFGMPKYRYIIDWLMKRAEIYGIISMPEELFQPHTHAKTCLVFLRKTRNPRPDYPIFMAVAKHCGHDSMGRTNDRSGKPLDDDLPLIVKRYEQFRPYIEATNPDPATVKHVPQDHLGFIHLRSALSGYTLIPKYYDPELEGALHALDSTHELVTCEELATRPARDEAGNVLYERDEHGKLILDKNDKPIEVPLIQWWSGHEPGKLEYGLGPVPFIRTSDISNWELKYDPKQSLSEELYERLKDAQDVRAGDILLVRDGTYLVGTCCILTEHDTRIVFCGGLYKIRVNDHRQLDPYLLLAVLNSPIVKRQIRSKQFTRDVIDTLGHRIREVVLPLPKDERERARVAEQTRWIVLERARLREEARQVALSVAANAPVTEEELEEVNAVL